MNKERKQNHRSRAGSERRPAKRAHSSKVGFEEASNWYDRCVEDSGHFYHRELIFPKLKKILAKTEALVDFGCGQGVAYRVLDHISSYVGIDTSPTLLADAKGRSVSKNRNATWIEQDLCHYFSEPFEKKLCEVVGGKKTDLLFLLSLQNMPQLEAPLQYARLAGSVAGDARLHIVLNHPCFRIPRQSHWGYDEAKKTQYRRVDRYCSPLEVPIKVGFQEKEQKSSMSYHNSLEAIFQALLNQGFVVTGLQEWCSHKKSSGSKAKAENRARSEIPLFLYLEASLSP